MREGNGTVPLSPLIRLILGMPFDKIAMVFISLVLFINSLGPSDAYMRQ